MNQHRPSSPSHSRTPPSDPDPAPCLPLASSQPSQYDDRLGPLGLCAAVVLALTAILVLAFIDFWDITHQQPEPGPDPGPLPSPALQPAMPVLARMLGRAGARVVGAA